MSDALDALLGASDLVAVLGREVVGQARGYQQRRAACSKATAGSRRARPACLRVRFEDAEYMDDVRVMRCQESEGGSGLYQLGAEFLWTTSPHERSLRRIISKLQGSAVRSVSFERQM